MIYRNVVLFLVFRMLNNVLLMVIVDRKFIRFFVVVLKVWVLVESSRVK